MLLWAVTSRMGLAGSFSNDVGIIWFSRFWCAAEHVLLAEACLTPELLSSSVSQMVSSWLLLHTLKNRVCKPSERRTLSHAKPATSILAFYKIGVVSICFFWYSMYLLKSTASQMLYSSLSMHYVYKEGFEVNSPFDLKHLHTHQAWLLWFTSVLS